MRRFHRVGLSLLAVVAIIGATFAFKALSKDVEVIVDGSAQSVSTYAADVEGVLKDAGIDAGQRDDVTPSLRSQIEDGAKINITRARMIDYSIDGIAESQWVTALTVDEAMSQLGVDATAYVSASRADRVPLEGGSYEIVTAKNIAIAVDGQTLAVTSTAKDVAALLQEHGIVLEGQDTVTPAATEAVTPGLQVTVDRIRTAQVEETQEIAFATVEQPDATMTKGTKKTVTEGVKGSQVVVYAITTTNGVETARTTVSVTVTVAPVDKVVKVGTKEAPATTATAAPRPASSGGAAAAPAPAPAPAAPQNAGGGADSLNWPALAKCESGGNPAAVSSTGKYHGLYQFSIATWNSVGGSGLPSQASPSEQTYRAKLLYNRSGAGQWPTCGKYLFS